MTKSIILTVTAGTGETAGTKENILMVRLPGIISVLTVQGGKHKKNTAEANSPPLEGRGHEVAERVFWFVYSSWLCLLCSSIFLISKEPDYPPPATRTPPLGENTKKHCRSSVFCLNIIRKDYSCTVHPVNS